MTQPIAIGTVLEVKEYGGGLAKYIVDSYNADNYLKMLHETKADTFMTLHPGHVRRIAEKGVDSGIKVLDAHSLNDVIVKVTQAKVNVAPIVTAPVVKPTAAVVVPAGNEGGSKKARALAIKATNPNATRKELIAMFVDQLGMTPAGASTYASMK